MRFCEFCGEEIEGTPYRRKKHAYCSKTCADEHEFEIFDEDDEESEVELEEEDEDERY
ncbi:MAG: hypothetical protein HZB43_06785 [candidate division Zixibacteria bacterium]|nr:hypothetical protein [candidate division Zixibacteria bacterium]